MSNCRVVDCKGDSTSDSDYCVYHKSKLSGRKLKKGSSRHRKNKYGAKRQTYNGVSYHSIKEAEYAEKLDWRKKAGDIKDWSGQHKLPLYVNGVFICNYFIDFKVIMPDNTVELHEVKGFETDLWRIKWRITKAVINEIEPDAKLVLIKV